MPYVGWGELSLCVHLFARQGGGSFAQLIRLKERMRKKKVHFNVAFICAVILNDPIALPL